MNYKLREDMARSDMEHAFSIDTSCLSGASFMDRLFITVAHADTQNLARLEKAFPVEVKVYREYTGVKV